MDHKPKSNLVRTKIVKNMNQLLKYLLCVIIGAAISGGGMWFAYRPIVKLAERPTVENNFKKIKTKKDSETTVDVSTLVETESKERKWRLFKRD
jgi:hypothetical protein